MRVALVDTSKKVYSIGLLKIGSWLKKQDCEVKYYKNSLPEKNEFDEIWISTIFTFDMPYSLSITREAVKRAKIVRCGGIAASLIPQKFEDAGAIVHQGLHPKAEKYPPDYSLLNEKPAFSITHTSRGCLRKCGFCMVRILEPTYYTKRKWENDLCEGAKDVLFYDNNWLAKGKKDIFKDIEKIKRLVADKKIKTIDFNQGLDCRLITEDIAKEFKGIPFKNRQVRFAFDGMHQDGYFQRAVEMMVRHAGTKEFMNYVLWNYRDTPEDLYYRLREHIRLTEELRSRVFAFPMRYQPILAVDRKREYIGIHWTKRQKSGFSRLYKTCITPAGLIAGVFAFKTLKEFEYYMTDSPEKFKKLISWPKIKEYVEKKKGNLRMNRRTTI